ncbi:MULTISPECIES: hypothetical protein [unclassified Paenibacillus]|uniref:hypothetical protein n=1 Tax=unclassified Paenibacillus TaxID=185978 RepID=UPI0009312E59|nr:MULTISPECIES: hypothetical protein [unclassified Paenibacillus]
MSYVLRHSVTGEIAACLQKNNYDLDYYGIRQWDSEQEAQEQKAMFLEQIGHDDEHRWLVLHLDESRVKLGNVKLKNDPARRLIMHPEGTLEGRLP